MTLLSMICSISYTALVGKFFCLQEGWHVQSAVSECHCQHAAVGLFCMPLLQRFLTIKRVLWHLLFNVSLVQCLVSCHLTSCTLQIVDAACCDPSSNEMSESQSQGSPLSAPPVPHSPHHPTLHCPLPLLPPPPQLGTQLAGLLLSWHSFRTGSLGMMSIPTLLLP